MTLTSSCEATPGLSIIERVGNTIISSKCFPEYKIMDVFDAGFNQVRQQPMYQLDLIADTRPYNSPGSSIWELRVSAFEAVGNTTGMQVDCSSASMP